ncbi:MAG: VWA domain-containing protein [Pyrinomonadaceae bacterium]
MKFGKLAITVLLATGTLGVFGQTTPPPPPPMPTPTPEVEISDEVIKIDTELVNVLFSAQDRQHRLLTNLTASDISIFENGEKQEIVEFMRQVDLPLSLSILIDTSSSQERTLPQEKDAANSFLEKVVRPSKDEVAIITFTGEVTLEQGMTSNIGRLRRAIDNVRYRPPSGYYGGGVVQGTPPISGSNQAAAGSTAIWDAIWVTNEEVLGPSPEKTRRAIILLTDGYNTYGLKKLDDAVKSAIRAEAVIYSIGIGDQFYDGVDKGVLRKLSESTGGRAFFPRDEMELRAAFKTIEEEMRSQYLISYEPINQTRDGSYRKINIEFANEDKKNEKVQLTYREGYFAKTSKKKSD